MIETPKENFKETIVRYGLVTVASYVVLILGTYILTEFFNVVPNISYAIIITLVYVGVYFANTHFVFAVEHKNERIPRYIMVLIIMWLLNNGVFNLLYELLEIQYLLAILINILLLGLLRFFIQKKFVFYKN